MPNSAIAVGSGTGSCSRNEFENPEIPEPALVVSAASSSIEDRNGIDAKPLDAELVGTLLITSVQSPHVLSCCKKGSGGKPMKLSVMTDAPAWPPIQKAMNNPK